MTQIPGSIFRRTLFWAHLEGSILLDPYTGAVITDATAGHRQFFRLAENWHRWLGGSAQSARATVIDISNLLFLFIVVSGIYLWLPAVWKWAVLRRLMFFSPKYVNGKARDFAWHHVFSVWALQDRWVPAVASAG